MNPLVEIGLDEQIACVSRELAIRKKVYPGWVKNGRMKQAQADREIAAMQAARDTLLKLKESPKTPQLTVGAILGLFDADGDLEDADY